MLYAQSSNIEQNEVIRCGYVSNSPKHSDLCVRCVQCSAPSISVISFGTFELGQANIMLSHCVHQLMRPSFHFSGFLILIITHTQTQPQGDGGSWGYRSEQLDGDSTRGQSGGWWWRPWSQVGGFLGIVAYQRKVAPVIWMWEICCQISNTGCNRRENELLSSKNHRNCGNNLAVTGPMAMSSASCVH